MDRRVLVVDDNALNLRLMKDILEDEAYIVKTVNNGQGVLDVVRDIKPEIILLDIMMPGMDGFEVCRRLKSDFECKNIPVIMVTAKTDSEDIKKALELGAFDYIKKPVDEVEVIARVQSALRFKEKEDMFREMAMKDSLTGVYNHALLIDLLGRELTKAQCKGAGIAFIMLDIDYFKRVNDTHGHISGNVVLKELTDILVTSVRPGDIVGRYGGEEFGIILPDISEEETDKLCEKIRKTVELHHFKVCNCYLGITVSIGVCFKNYGSKHGLDKFVNIHANPVATDNDEYFEQFSNFGHQEMVKIADKALYEAKRNGRNRVSILK